MSKLNIALSVLIIAAAAYAGYKFFVPPSVTVEQFDSATQRGKFRFAGKTMEFGSETGAVIGGPFGWEVDASVVNGVKTFKLSQFGKPKGDAKILGINN